MISTPRSPQVVVIGTALSGIALGVLVGLLWWVITPTEQWIKLDGGLGAADLNSSAWFAADGWFLILGVAGGLVLTAVTWVWVRQNPISVVVGLIVGSALLAVVAWSLGGLLGPADPKDAAASLAVGATVDGSLGLRAMGVLAAPTVAAMALVALLIALAPVREDLQPAVPDAEGVPATF